MSFLLFLRALPLAALLALGAAPSAAHEGHDDAPAAATGTALPRFAAVSDDFELVGVLNGQRLSLYLDHARDNRPAEGAKLELEIGGAPVVVEPHGEAGEFEAVLTQGLPEGDTAVMATVTAGAATDLLTGSFHIEAAAHDAAEATPAAWQRIAPWAVAAALALGAAAFWARSRRTSTTPGATA